MSHQSGETYCLTKQDCEDAYGQCLSSRHITSNEEYSRKTSRTKMLFEEDADWLNAYAFRIPAETKDAMSKEYPGVDWRKYDHCVAISAGMLRYLDVLSAVCEFLDRTGNISKAKKMLKWMADRITVTQVGSDYVYRFEVDFDMEDDGRRSEVQRMYGMGMLVAIFGHELGHVCLGHCLGRENNSVSRNNERAADGFASSIIHANAGGGIPAVAACMFHIGLMWAFGKHNGTISHSKENGFGTHPVTQDRVLEYIDSFNSVLETSRITAEMLKKLTRGC